MAENVARVKGRYAGLKTYLKSLLGELNLYVSSDDCDKTVGVEEHGIAGILEQLAVVYNEIISLIDPKARRTLSELPA